MRVPKGTVTSVEPNGEKVSPPATEDSFNYSSESKDQGVSAK